MAPSTAVALVEQELTEVRTELAQEQETNRLLQESLLDLERDLFDPGWQRMVALTEIEFAPEALRQMRAICKVFAIKNPLIKRGLNLRSAYVWGQGVEIQARANGRRERPGEQDVNTVVQAFLTDPGNLRTLTGPEARGQLARALGTDGEYFIALFTRPTTGQVQARIIPADEIADVVSNPEDSSEPWYYRRRWYTKTVEPATGVVRQVPQEKLYPAEGYRPRVRPSAFGSVPVGWDSPIIHVAVNRPLGWQHGVPHVYAAIDWANAYRQFLEDWAKLVRSLSRYAWRMTAPGRAQAQARAAISKGPTVDPITREPNSAGATAFTPPNVTLEAIPKTGATIDSESGRPLAMMVAAALGIPVTMLLADPGQTGARATAETLDQPTELEMGEEQELNTGVIQRLCEYVIRESVRAPQGGLRGVITQDPWTGRETTSLAGDTDTTIDVTWPELDDLDVGDLLDGLKKVSDIGVLRPEELLRLILTALGVRNVDELVEDQLDEDGNFIWPSTGPEPAAAPPGVPDPGSMTPGDDGQPDGTQPPADGQPQQQPAGDPAEGG